MMPETSDVYVWSWLRRQCDPVPAGVLQQRGGEFWFAYGRSYLQNAEAVSLSPDMPLSDESYPPTADLGMPGGIRDASPDAWGRRVVMNTLTGKRGADVDTADLDERTYMLHSASNRLGAIDFQESPREYIPRGKETSLEEMMFAADAVEAGKDVPEPLHAALLSGTAMGGARPKAMLTVNGIEHLAKFSSSTDQLPVVQAEAASTWLAQQAGIDVPHARVEEIAGRTILLTERFDRDHQGGRYHVVSALTLSGLGEMTSRYGSYPDFLGSIREYGEDPGEELFRRVAFNISISNSDDHLRNHAALWNGELLRLTPAYDLAPMNRSGETASQAIAYGADGQRESNFASLLECHADYGLTQKQARRVTDEVIDATRNHWLEAADFARLSKSEREALWGRQFLNPGTMYDYPRSVVIDPQPTNPQTQGGTSRQE